jgi:hypothetical protein
VIARDPKTRPTTTPLVGSLQAISEARAFRPASFGTTLSNSSVDPVCWLFLAVSKLLEVCGSCTVNDVAAIPPNTPLQIPARQRNEATTH